MMKPTPYPAPQFSLKDTEGKTYSLADYKGKWLVLYFYPKDDTPGCTIEACAMRDARDDLTEFGAEVVGVSRDEAASHDKFKAKYNLNFTLLRKTFIINPEGQVVKVYGRVTPLGHGEQVVEALRILRK
jgi:peroxiredoxin Q/BCP